MTSGTRRIVPRAARRAARHSVVDRRAACADRSPRGSALPRPRRELGEGADALDVRVVGVADPTGSGVPQYRSREIAQSMLFVSHSPNRPSPIVGGCQSTRALRASIASRNAVVRTNHDVRA